VRVDGVLEIRKITLPPELDAKRHKGSKIRASYQFEAITRVRGALWDLSRRVADENSAVFRTYGELFPDKAVAGDTPNRTRPQLFTAYLNADARVTKNRPSLGFSVDLGVQVPEYVVDGEFWMKDHFAGGYLYREKINLEAIPPSGDTAGWTLRYGVDSRTPNRATQAVQPDQKGDTLEFRIPVVQSTRPGIDATLVLTARSWNT
jgi:hypothetical protein